MTAREKEVAALRHQPVRLGRRAFIGGAGALALAGCGDDAPRPLYSSDTHPADYPTVAAVREMGRLLHQRTDGALDIKIFAGGQLGSERDTLEITSFGGLDLTRIYLAPLTAIEPITTVATLPFLFRSTAHMRASLDGAPGEAILASLEPHGLIGLCFYDSGERSFYNSRRPIERVADMTGLKVRVPSADLYVAMMRALGADATPMPLGEVYQALVQGVIDGAENNWPSYQSGRHYEPAPYYSLTRHIMAPEVLVMSRMRWQALGPELQRIVRQAAKDSVPFMRRLWDVRVDQARAELLAAGVIANDIADLPDFAARMRPVWQQFIQTPEQRKIVRQIEELADA